MRNSVPCDYFGEGQEIKLNINSYSRIQEKMKTPIGELFSLTRSLDVALICELLAEGLRQYGYHDAQWYGNRIQELLDSGKVDSIADIQMLVAKAVIASKFFGKEMYFLTFPEEMTEEDKEWMKALEEKRNAPKNA